MELLRQSRAIGPGVAVVLAAGLIGCSIHPLPENISRASTFDIVERIRCEVLEGLRDFTPHEKEKAEKIIDATAIGYDFEFAIEEKNAASGAKLEYKRPAFKGEGKGFFLEIRGGAETERKNTRIFRIVDKLSDLRRERGERCDGTITTANGLYPITGATGMAEVVRTYVKLEMLSDFARGDKGVVFSDDLEFMTKFSAGVTPKIELATVAGQFRLSHASFTGTASREDIHSVTVALSRGQGDVDMVRTVTAMLGPRPVGKAAAFDGEPLIRPYRTVRRLLASQGPGPETRVLYELQRRRNAREDARVVSRVLFGTK